MRKAGRRETFKAEIRPDLASPRCQLWPISSGGGGWALDIRKKRRRGPRRFPVGFGHEAAQPPRKPPDLGRSLRRRNRLGSRRTFGGVPCLYAAPRPWTSRGALRRAPRRPLNGMWIRWFRVMVGCGFVGARWPVLLLSACHSRVIRVSFACHLRQPVSRLLVLDTPSRRRA